jgi:glycosyltransferase involved in cell wall biosynthesis
VPADAGTGTGDGPLALFVVTEDWYFVSHRLPMARAAAAAGFRVAVATRVDRHADAIRAEGFALHPLPWSRSERGALAVLRRVLALAALFRRLRPALVHLVALKPILLGGLALRLVRAPAAIHSLNGLGSGFLGDRAKDRLRRAVLLGFMRVAFRRARTRVIVQNGEDLALVEARGLARPGTVRLIPGSGIEIDRFVPLAEPDAGPPTVAFVGRMLRYKGPHLVVEAQAILRARGVDVGVLLAGTPDPDNPGSIDEATLRDWGARPGVRWLGHVADVRTVHAQAHMAVLVSKTEGIPRSLLEAMACGRPVIAGRAPGGPEVARDDTGLLVPVDDAEALADAIGRLATDPALRRRLGAGARRLVEREMSAEAVGAATVALYRDVLAE